MANRIPAEIFPPGDFLKEELEARGWTQTDLAEILGRNQRVVSEIVSAKRAITPETASGLAKAFGTSAQFWMNLESAWQLSKLKPEGEEIIRRSRLYSRFPVKEILRRGWVETSNSIEVLEARFLEFFGLTSVDQELPKGFAFRKSDCVEPPTPMQLAWVCQAKRLAEAMVVPQFSEKKFAECFDEIRKYLSSAEEVRHIPRLLSQAGVRFVVLEPLPGSRIDGVCFWVNQKKSPVVALSLRFDRIDSFWFSLIHELRHVANGDGKDEIILEVDLVGDESDRAIVPEFEKRADAEAAEFLIPKGELSSFVARVKPLYSEERIRGFANRIGVHPGVVVGRLQKEKEIPYANLRKLLVKVREYIVPNSISDGWGSIAPVNQ